MSNADSNPNVELLRTFLAASGFQAPTIVERRQAMDALVTVETPPGVTLEPTVVAGRPAEWIDPIGGDHERVLLYLHGGAYCIGSIASHRLLAATLAVASQGRVLLLDYRLAPEHPCPAAVDDATAGYRALLDAGYDPARLAIGGDSAGGGLTLATLVALRDAGDPLPATGVLLSAWTDLTNSSESWTTRAEADPVVDRVGLDMMAAAYLAGRPATDPAASPHFADVRGLPPLLVQVGDAEVLRDDSVAVRDAAVAGGVEVTLDIWDGMVHVFQAFGPDMFPEAGESTAKIGQWLIAHTSP